MQSLLLWIETCSCSCGNRWTHSYLTYSTGGTPRPQDELKLKVERIEPTRRNSSSCFRCVPLGLGIGWTRPEPAPETKPARSAKDLLS